MRVMGTLRDIRVVMRFGRCEQVDDGGVLRS